MRHRLVTRRCTIRTAPKRENRFQPPLSAPTHIRGHTPPSPVELSGLVVHLSVPRDKSRLKHLDHVQRDEQRDWHEVGENNDEGPKLQEGGEEGGLVPVASVPPYEVHVLDVRPSRADSRKHASHQAA